MRLTRAPVINRSITQYSPQHVSLLICSRLSSSRSKAWPKCGSSWVPTLELEVRRVLLDVIMIISNHRARSSAGRLHRTSIHILDDDSLLNIFRHCRPALLDEGEADDSHILRGGEWSRERWWYKLVHVCRRWRTLILASPSHLHLCLVCTHRTPVAKMLAHSPPLPLIIDHIDRAHSVTAKDEEWILLALRQRVRVRRIRILMPISNLRKLTTAMDKEFPMLEYMYMSPPTKEDTSLTLPGTFRAPRLRHLLLRNFAFSIASPLLATSIGPIILSLEEISTSAYFSPTDLLQRLSSMPQLETLGISFHSPIPNTDARSQLLQMPTMTHVSLPNLRWFGFGGMSAYLEALLPRLSIPRIEKLQIWFFSQPSYPVPHLLQSMRAAENIRFRSASLMFHEKFVALTAYPHEGARVYAFYLEVCCRLYDLQVESVAKLFNGLRTELSAVDHLSLEYERDSPSQAWANGAYRGQWRDVLGLFSNVETLLVPNGLIRDLSASLELDDGESSSELLPKLKELQYLARRDSSDAFTTFIKSRRNTGRPVTLVHQKARLFHRSS
jgi:hypothetical protein